MSGGRAGEVLLAGYGRPRDGPEFSDRRSGRTGEGRGQRLRFSPREFVGWIAQHPNALAGLRDVVDTRPLVVRGLRHHALSIRLRTSYRVCGASLRLATSAFMPTFAARCRHECRHCRPGRPLHNAYQVSCSSHLAAFFCIFTYSGFHKTEIMCPGAMKQTRPLP